MQHAEHFLSRLDRLSNGDTEFALELYRDPELVHGILEAASLPEGASRIAISLDDPVWGPFIIVTRDGHFVTCLGRGMCASNTHVVTRTTLDAISRRLERLREKLAVKEKLYSDKRESKRLLRRLFVESDSVSREDFLAVAAWEPLFGPAFLDLYLSMACEVAAQGPEIRRLRSRGARAEKVLYEFWNLLHATSHIALLGAISAEKEHYVKLTQDIAGARASLSYSLTGTGIVRFILRGAWAAGRMGKLMLADYKRALVEDAALFEFFDTLFGLLALGMRSSGLRAEIIKALRAAPNSAQTPGAQRLRDAGGQSVAATCELTAQLLECDPDEHAMSLRSIGENFFDSDAPQKDDPIREDLVRTLPLLLLNDGITDGKKLAMTMTLLAATARGAPEQFYLPREIAQALHQPWKPEDVLRALDPQIRADRIQRKPDVRKVTVGRNDPCPCKSGRKWKKCCGA